MKEKWIINRNLAIVFGAGILMMTACAEPEKPPIKKPVAPVEEEQPKTAFLQMGNKLFSVPSPMEMAMLINEINEGYSEDLLSNSDQAASYTSRFQQAINLGIYGADLGYALSYEQNQAALGYLKSCKKLAAELGISGSLYTDLMGRFENHMDNKDSLLSFIGETFRASDAYLQENDSRDISTLILAGGWLESLYFATEVSKVVANGALTTRIGEQKNSLSNLISLLNPHKDETGFDNLITQLKELSALFDNVEYSYTFVSPTIDTANQVVIVNSKSSVKITPEQLDAISNKVKEIRKQLIG